MTKWPNDANTSPRKTSALGEEKRMTQMQKQPVLLRRPLPNSVKPLKLKTGLPSLEINGKFRNSKLYNVNTSIRPIAALTDRKRMTQSVRQPILIQPLPSSVKPLKQVTGLQSLKNNTKFKNRNFNAKLQLPDQSDNKKSSSGANVSSDDTSSFNFSDEFRDKIDMSALPERMSTEQERRQSRSKVKSSRTARALAKCNEQARSSRTAENQDGQLSHHGKSKNATDPSQEARLSELEAIHLDHTREYWESTDISFVDQPKSLTSFHIRTASSRMSDLSESQFDSIEKQASCDDADDATISYFRRWSLRHGIYSTQTLDRTVSGTFRAIEQHGHPTGQRLSIVRSPLESNSVDEEEWQKLQSKLRGSRTSLSPVEASQRRRQSSVIHTCLSPVETSQRRRQSSVIHTCLSPVETSQRRRQSSVIHTSLSPVERSQRRRQSSVIHTSLSPVETSQRRRQSSVIHTSLSPVETSQRRRQSSVIHRAPPTLLGINRFNYSSDFKWNKAMFKLSCVATMARPSDMKLPRTKRLENAEIGCKEILIVVKKIICKKEKQLNRWKWQRAIRLLIILMRFRKVLSERTYETEQKHKTFLDIGDSAKVSVRLSDGRHIPSEELEALPMLVPVLTNHGRQILSCPPEERTEEEVSQALRDLQYSHAFCAFPLAAQHELARWGTYHLFSKQRVIIKTGHVPQNYYFILCGQAQATKLQTVGGISLRATETILSQGHSFGQEAIVGNRRHSYSVISRQEMQLLSIPKDHFFALFKDDTLDPVPVHVRFLGQLEWMKHWPLHQLLRHPTQSFMHYCRNRQVIVADSSQSEYLYVVRSGRCSVLMLIDRVQCTWRDFPALMPPDGLNIDDHLARLEKKTLVQEPLRMVPNHSASDIDLRKLWDKSTESTKDRRIKPRFWLHQPRKWTVVHKTDMHRDDDEESSAETGSERRLERDELGADTGQGRKPRIPFWKTDQSEERFTSEQGQQSEERFTSEQGQQSKERSTSEQGQQSEERSTSEQGQQSEERSTSSGKNAEARGKSAGTSPENQNETGSKESKQPFLPRIESDRRRSVLKGATGPDRVRRRRQGAVSFVDRNQNQDSQDQYSNNGATNSLPSLADQSRTSSHEGPCSLPTLSLSGDERIQMWRDSLPTTSGQDNYISWEDRRMEITNRRYRRHRRRLTPSEKPVSCLKKRKEYKVPGRCRPPIPPKVPPKRNIAVKEPFYAEVGILKEGDVFGLDQLKLKLLEPLQVKKYTVSLVSCGAEVIALDKRFFITYADSKTEQMIFNMIRAYPSPYQLQQKQKYNMAWALYIDKINEETQKEIAQTKRNYGTYFEPGPVVDPMASVGLITDTR